MPSYWRACSFADCTGKDASKGDDVDADLAGLRFGTRASLQKSELFLAITPEYTWRKAMEIYGGAPRPLSARHAFVDAAFASDTEDWRSNAFIGDRSKDVARLEITGPKARAKQAYLEQTARRQPSYYRQKSLVRAISYRAPLYKKDGELADNQYHDQKVTKDESKAVLQRQLTQSRTMARSEKGERNVSFHTEAAETTTPRGRTEGDMGLHASLSRIMSRGRSQRGEAIPSTNGEANTTVTATFQRAITRVMSRAREPQESSRQVSFAGDASPRAASPRLKSQTSVEEPCPGFDDL